MVRKAIVSKLSQGAASAIEGINKAGSTVDAALAGARRKGAGYPQMKALLQAMNEAAHALQVLAQAPSVETGTGSHISETTAANDSFVRDSHQARQNCSTEIGQIRLWQAEQVRMLSGTATHLLRRAMEFALQRNGRLNLVGLGLAYLAGAFALFILDFSSKQVLAMALSFPLAGWALALLADQQLARAADAIAANAAQKIADAEQRCDGELARLDKSRAVRLGQIGDELKQRLSKIAQITAQADSMLGQRAKEADQVFAAWTRQTRTGFLQIEQSHGASAPPDLLELGTLKCKLQ